MDWLVEIYCSITDARYGHENKIKTSEEINVFGIVRAILGLLNAFSLIAFGRSVQKTFGMSAGIWYALLQASQFHVMYYSSRTLPNMYASVFSKLSLSRKSS